MYIFLTLYDSPSKTSLPTKSLDIKAPRLVVVLLFRGRFNTGRLDDVPLPSATIEDDDEETYKRCKPFVLFCDNDDDNDDDDNDDEPLAKLLNLST